MTDCKRCNDYESRVISKADSVIEEAHYEAHTAAQEREAKLQAEIEKQKNTWWETTSYLQGERDNLQAENAKLRAELEYYKDSTILQVKLKAAVELERDKLRGVVAHLRSQVERLREVLKKYADREDISHIAGVVDALAATAQAERLSDSEGSSADVLGIGK